jgi:hypothetical protein
VMPQHAAEHFSKRAHVIAQRLMRIGLHRVMVQDRLVGFIWGLVRS